MPQAFFASFVKFAATKAGIALAAKTVSAVAAALQFVTFTAASMAASRLLRPKMPNFSDALGSRDQMVRSPIAARQIIYGRAKVSGTIVYLGTTGATNEYLHMVVAVAGHEVEELGDVYFNEDLVLTGAGDGAATGKYAGHADIWKKLGAAGQTAFSQLVTDTASLTNGKWTSDHKLTGIACIYVRLKFNQEIFVGGIPNVSVIVRGKKVFDPRTSTTAYSTNPALCLRDYLTSSLGLGMATSEIDDTACIVAANECEEQVQILPLSPVTNENRYEANGVVITSESPDGVIGKLLSSMGGLCAYSGGRLTMYAGTYQVPTLSFSEKHFVGPISVATRSSARDRVNTVKGIYTSEANQWQPSDFPVISSATYVTEDNSVRYTRDVALPFTTSASMAQRLAVIELRRARQEIVLTARFRLEAMQIRAGETVMISNAKLGWTNKVFEVMEWRFVTEGEPPTLAVDMTLREMDSTVYSWTVSDQIAVTAAPNTTLPNPWSVTAPTNLALVADGTTQVYQADGTAISRIQVSWSSPADEFVRSGGSIEVEWKRGDSTTYLHWSSVPGDQTREFIDGGVVISVSYDVRIYAESYFGVSSSYVTASVTVAPDTTPPAIPTGLTATLGTGRAISLDWDDNIEPDFSEYGIYRNTSGVTPGLQTALWATGTQAFGQLGIGDTTTRSSPVQVGTVLTWSSVAGGVEHTAATRVNGSLWTWGRGISGETGHGDTATRSTPVQVGALTDWSQVACGGFFTVALKTDGTLWSFGSNGFGQLGLGNTTNRSSPVQIGASTTWAYVAANSEHAAAVKTDGSLWTWGNGASGRLGHGNITSQSSPTQVGALTNWATVHCLGAATIARKTDGTLWAWGLNGSGQLGLGDTANRSSPVQVGALTDWISVASGHYSVIARRSNGTAWAWGSNTNGELGLGTVASRSSPTQLGGSNEWSVIEASRNSFSGVKPNGTLWTWGRGNEGQLGSGSVASRSSPVQVGALATWNGLGKFVHNHAIFLQGGSAGGGSGGADKIAETRASRFVDAEVSPGVTYYYWLNAYDRLENVSDFSARVQATPAAITAGSVDQTPPANPTALTSVTFSTYLASDGGARALVVVTVAALPARAALQNVLYRKQGHANSYEVAAQVSNTAPISAVLDDLTPGVTYDIASQAWSFSNVPSDVITAAFSPYVGGTAPAPATPTGGALSNSGIIPNYLPGTDVLNFGTRISWNANTERDLAAYEVKATVTDTDAATDYSWFPSSGGGLARVVGTEEFLYNAVLGAGYVRVRAVNRSGVASGWHRIGNANSAASTGLTSLGEQRAGNVSITGGTIKIPTGGQRGFEAGVSTAVDVLGADLRVYNTSTVEKFRVDDGTGQVSIDGNRVLSTRYATAPVTLADVIAVLTHHGLAP
jgi:alpha-tubulin suppressor-like RCC1 family protein